MPELHRVIYRGRTWAVTSYGIERHVRYVYEIEKTRLLEIRKTSKGPVLDWLPHIAEKPEDYDFLDFLHCYMKALAIFRRQVSAALLKRSIEEALDVYMEDKGELPQPSTELRVASR